VLQLEAVEPLAQICVKGSAVLLLVQQIASLSCSSYKWIRRPNCSCYCFLAILSLPSAPTSVSAPA